MLALFGVQANAQTSFRSDDVKIWADNVVMTADNSTVSYLKVNMTDLTRQYAGFQMEIHVPKGIHLHQIATGRGFKYDTKLNQYRFDGLGHSVTINMPTETVIKLSVVDFTTNAEFYSDAMVDGEHASDVDRDGYLSITDLTCVTEIMNGRPAYNASHQELPKSNADVNGDGKVDLKDVEQVKEVLIAAVDNLISIGLVADESTLSGTYDVQFKTAEMITKQAIGYQPTKEVTCKFIINGGADATSVKSIGDVDSEEEEYYGVDGVKRNSIKRGVNIIKSETSSKKVLK